MKQAGELKSELWLYEGRTTHVGEDKGLGGGDNVLGRGE